MTNGTKFKEVFKISQVDECDLNVYAWLPIHDAIEIPLEWWNAEYEEPTTKNDLGVDAISRKQAIEEADKLCLETGYDNEKVIEMLNELPSVTPQLRKGHWIRISPAEIYECSECGQNVMTSDICVYKFCHGCGIKMVELQESEG